MNTKPQTKAYETLEKFVMAFSGMDEFDKGYTLGMCETILKERDKEKDKHEDNANHEQGA